MLKRFSRRQVLVTAGAVVGLTLFAGGLVAVASVQVPEPAERPASVERISETPTPSPTPTPTATPTPAPVVEAPPAPEPEPVAEDPVYVEPAPEPEPIDDGVPDGYWPVPWIPSDDPNNANGGDWDMSQCFTHGEWINGATYCAP